MLTNEVKILDGPLSCLAANKLFTNFAVGGRNVFQILNCENQTFEEKCNFRFGVSASCLYLSVNDIAWSHHNENVLVSASNHGAVVIWNIANYNQPVQDCVMKELRRSVNCLQFYPDSADNLLVASQDGACRCIDLRRQGFVTSFGPSVECAAREVQFNPHKPEQFAVVFEDGSCELWDTRVSQRYERQWIAHRGPCVCMDWHPKNNWLVTGGRDKIAVVWDMAGDATNPASVYSAETVASVGRVKWRPGHDFSILTSSMLLTETNVNIWDVRRPYVPQAFFVEHRENIAGVLWKDENMFYTCGRDSKLCRFVYSKRSHLKSLLNPVALSINNEGSIVTATHDQLFNNNRPTARLRSIPTLPSISQADSETNDVINQQQPTNLITQHSSLFLFPPHHDTCTKNLRLMAENYEVEGSNVHALCQHNAQVAACAKQTQISSSWMMLKLMLPSAELLARERMHKPDNKPNNHENVPKCEKGMIYDISTESNEDSESLDEPLVGGAKLTMGVAAQLFDDSVKFDNSSIFDDFVLNVSPPQQNSQMVLHPDSDGGLIDADVDLNFFNNESTAQQPDLSTTTIVQIIDIDSQSYMESRMQMEEVIKEEILQCPPFIEGIQPFQFAPIIIEMLNMYANQNDVQTAVSMGLTLGHPYIHQLPLFDNWVDSYVDLLNELGLYVIATLICKLSRQDKPHISTALKTCCSRCSRPLHSGGLCRRCPSTNHRSTYIHNCALCHRNVCGLFVWCQGCSHGGHVEHIRMWFDTNIECPTGCGHFCQYV